MGPIQGEAAEERDPAREPSPRFLLVFVVLLKDVRFQLVEHSLKTIDWLDVGTNLQRAC